MPRLAPLSGLDPWSVPDPRSGGALNGAWSWGEEAAFGRSSVSGVEVAGAADLASGLFISVLTRNAARRTLKMNIAPTRSRAERGHDGRAVRIRERAWLTLVLPPSDSSKMPNSMLPVVAFRRGERVRRFLLRPTCSGAYLHHIPMTGSANGECLRGRTTRLRRAAFLAGALLKRSCVGLSRRRVRRRRSRSGAGNRDAAATRQSRRQMGLPVRL